MLPYTSHSFLKMTDVYSRIIVSFFKKIPLDSEKKMPPSLTPLSE